MEVYKSKDLKKWTAPKLVFQKPENFWGGKEIWAPEMHRIGPYFYMFVTFDGREGGRGTQILRAEKPDGPFILFSADASTPEAERSLDGTPWIDAAGQNWMVYCHEWVQIKDGAIKAVRMSKDFSKRLGKPRTLFHASEASWPVAYKDGNYVTDGPFLYRNENGTLLMLWSSIGKEDYAVGLAWSENGKIEGSWTHQAEPVFSKDGGHCMLFKTFEGQLMMALHQPNGGKAERLRLFKVTEHGDGLNVEPFKPWETSND